MPGYKIPEMRNGASSSQPERGSSVAADGTESSEEEQMDTDQGRRPGNGVQDDMSAPDHEWDKQQFWSHLDNQFNMLRDSLKAQFWMQEYYRQQDYEQAERVRHYHDLIANRPPVPKYTPIDYSQLPRPSEVGPQSFVPPPYPGIPPPMFYRSPPRAGDEGGPSQGRTTSPWDMAPVAQEFYESLFSDRPPVKDLPKGLTFSYNGGVGSSAAADSTESSEEEQMDTDQGRRPGNGVQHDMSAPDHEWGRTQFQQQFWSHQDNQFNMLRDALKAQFWMQEYYRQQDYEQAERVRHYHDLIADRPPVPEYTPIDYSQLQRPSEVGPQSFVPPPYPGIPPPMFKGSFQGRTTSPWDVAPLAQGFYESLFSYPPSGPQ